MVLYIKKFQSLSLNELFAIIQARERVFHLEQKVTVAEYDDEDKISYHFYLVDNDKLIAYDRLYEDKEEKGTFHIGRLLSMERRKGYGTSIFSRTIKYAEEKLGAKKFVIHAQTYIKEFYKKFGFEEVGETFLEAGIEHITMILEKDMD